MDLIVKAECMYSVEIWGWSEWETHLDLQLSQRGDEGRLGKTSRGKWLNDGWGAVPGKYKQGTAGGGASGRYMQIQQEIRGKRKIGEGGKTELEGKHVIRSEDL